MDRDTEIAELKSKIGELERMAGKAKNISAIVTAISAVGGGFVALGAAVIAFSSHWTAWSQIYGAHTGRNAVINESQTVVASQIADFIRYNDAIRLKVTVGTASGPVDLTLVPDVDPAARPLQSNPVSAWTADHPVKWRIVR